jgi:hypothetical protein
MDKEVKQALTTDRLVDISTTGRKTGNPHRIDILFHFFDERIYLSGMPGEKEGLGGKFISKSRICLPHKAKLSKRLACTGKNRFR